MKKLKSERGATLLLVMGLILILVLLMTPLLMNLNVGLLQTATDGHTEVAFDEAESAAAVYKRLFNEAVKVEEAKNSHLEESDAVALATNLHTAKLFPNLQVTPLISASKKAVQFASYSGTGQQKRGRAVELGFEQITSTTTETGNSTSEDVFYWKHGVVMDKSNYNNIFTNVGTSPNTKNYQFINNSYPSNNYTTEFNDYMKKYTGESFATRSAFTFNAWPVVTLDQPLPALPVPAEVTAISNANTNNTTLSPRDSSGINYSGNVNFTASSSPVTINKLGNGNAIEATGSVTFTAPSQVTLKGSIKIGQDLIADNNSGNGQFIVEGNVLVRGNAKFTQKSEYIYIKGDLLVQGDLSIGQITKEIVVDGNVIVGGNIQFPSTVEKLVVKGSLSSGSTIEFMNTVKPIIIGGNFLAGKDMNFLNTVEYLQVKGVISAINNITFSNTVGIISAGNWSTEWSSESGNGESFYLAGTVVGNDRHSIIAGNILDFNNTITTLRSTGNLSANTLLIKNTMTNIRINGSMIANGDISIIKPITDWIITENLYSNGLIRFFTVHKFLIKGSVYARTKITNSSTFTNFTVEGSMLSQGPIELENTLNNFKIGGNLLSLDSISFGNTVKNLSIGGNIQAINNIQFYNDTDVMNVSGNIIAGSNMVFAGLKNTTISGSVLVKNNVTFYNERKGNYGISNVIINGDFIAKGAMEFYEVFDLTVNGAVASGADMTFIIKITKFQVAKDIMTSGSFIVAENMSVDKGWKVTGMLAALRDIRFTNNISDGVTFGGFYSGGSVTLANWYGNGSSAKGNIKIKHNPPSTTITKEITITKTKISTNWNSRVTYGSP